MTPKELYSREPESVSKDINILRGCGYYSHIPEITDDIVAWMDDETIAKNEKIEIKVYKNFDFDGRRSWLLASVWFDGNPVMIIQNAGREGDDYVRRFVTDTNAYFYMIEYIHSILPPPPIRVQEDIVDVNEEIEGLTEFYGNSLDGYFRRYYIC